jgi:hypothetical protein
MATAELPVIDPNVESKQIAKRIMIWRAETHQPLLLRSSALGQLS